MIILYCILSFFIGGAICGLILTQIYMNELNKTYKEQIKYFKITDEERKEFFRYTNYLHQLNNELISALNHRGIVPEQSKSIH